MARQDQRPNIVLVPLRYCAPHSRVIKVKGSNHYSHIEARVRLTFQNGILVIDVTPKKKYTVAFRFSAENKNLSIVKLKN